MYYRRRKGFISKMDPALFVAVVCTNDKDAIIKYISQCRVAFVEYTVLDEC
jgi:hypothetical protein